MDSQNNTFDNYLSLKQVSEILHVHPNTLRAWDKKGILKSSRFGLRKDRHYAKQILLNFVNQKNVSLHKEPINQTDFEIKLEKAKIEILKLSNLQQTQSLLNRAKTTKQFSQILTSQIDDYLNQKNSIFITHLDKGEPQILSCANLSKHDLKNWQTIAGLKINPIRETFFNHRQLNINSTDELIIRYPALKKAVESSHYCSIFFFPILNNKRVEFVITVLCNKDNTISKNSLGYLVSVASLASKNFTKLQKQHQLSEELSKTRSLNILLEDSYNSALKIFNSSSLEELYTLTLTEAINLTESRCGMLILGKRHTLEIAYASIDKLYQSIPRAKGRSYKTFVTQKPYLFRVPKQNDPHPELREFGIKSIIYIPISYNNKPLGVLGIQSTKEVNLSKKQLNTLKLFGDAVGITLAKYLF